MIAIPRNTTFGARLAIFGEGVRGECDCGWHGPLQVRNDEVWPDIRTHLATPHFEPVAVDEEWAV